MYGLLLAFSQNLGAVGAIQASILTFRVHVRVHVRVRVRVPFLDII